MSSCATPSPLTRKRPFWNCAPLLELTIEVRAPSPDLYFNVLRDSIEDLIIRRWPGLAYQLFVPCPGGAADASTCRGQFSLDGLLRLREKGHKTYPCIECTQVHEISLLLTGFTAPDRPLVTELEQVHNQLARIESGIIRVEGQAAETADSVRRMLRVVSEEVTDCPRLFTLAEEHPTRVSPTRLYQAHYRLTLWCEHPGFWHPLGSGQLSAGWSERLVYQGQPVCETCLQDSAARSPFRRLNSCRVPASRSA